MTLHVKPADAVWHTVTQPYVKTGASTWSPATKVLVKTGASTWTEVWPLVPGIPTALTSTQPYQNDRIEFTFAWTAPSTGAATIYYKVLVYIGGSLYNTYTINAPTVSMTLTNGSSGFQSYAGQTMYFTVTPYSTGDRAGAMATSANFTVPQLPAPPLPSSFAVVLTNGDLSESWAHSGGNRLTGFTLEVQYNGGSWALYSYGAATTVNVAAAPWVGSSINGGSFSARVKANGPGGSSAYVTISGNIPSDPGMDGVRFLNGIFQANFYLGANSTAMNTFFLQAGGALNGDTTFGGGAAHQLAGSSGWARDGSTQYAWAAQGVQSGLGTSRIVYSNYVRKMAMPINITAIDANTWRGAGYRSDGFVYQGYTVNGMNYGYAFYGDGFRDAYNTTLVGYGFTITSARMALNRAPGGYSSYVAPRLWLHTAANAYEGDNQFAGGVDTDGLPINTYGWVTLPVDWLYYLRDQTNGWQGFGFFHPNTTVNGSFSTSNEYMKLYTGAIGPMGVYAFQVQVFHDG